MNGKTRPSFLIRQRHRIEYLGLAFAVALVQRLPFGSLRWIAWFLGGIVFLLDRRNRRVALANLDCVFGTSKTPQEKNLIARDAYRTFARTMLELCWGPNLNRDKVYQLARFEGLDAHPCHSDPKQPIIYFCFHYSNFEWLSLFGPFVVGKAFVVTQRFKNPLLGPVFDRLRGCTGHEVLTQEKAFIRMFKHLKKGKKFFMLTDLTLDPREASVIIDCFGKKTCVTQLHAAMALRTGAKIVPVECQPRADGGYLVKVHPPVEWPEGAEEQEITQLAWDALESSIRARPELWIWAYKHWRFRPSEAPIEDYPFYANSARRFDKKLPTAKSE